MLNMILDMHVHTFYSKGRRIFHDGLASPKQMVKRAKKIGLDGVAITDHNTIEAWEETKKLAKKYGILIIPGEEIDTLDGHLLALGIQERIEPDMILEETLDKIHEQGGLAIAAHPFDIAGCGLGSFARLADGLEAFNAMNIDRVINRKAKRFARKYSLPVTAGSDAHTPDMLGYGRTEVRAEDVDAVLRQIRKGRTILHEEYMPTRVLLDYSIARLKLSYFYVMDYMAHNYRWPKRYVGKKLLSLVNKSPGNIDYLFRILAYLALVGASSYAMLREFLYLFRED